MSLLLDTHVVLWWLSDDPALATELKDRLDHEPDVYVSAATIWEIAIKQSIGKLKLPSWPPSRNAPSFASTVRSATTAPRGVRGLGPRSRNTGTAPGSRFPRAGGRQAVEVPGIEPGSFGVSSGLLRAQLTLPLLAPSDHVSKSL